MRLATAPGQAIAAMEELARTLPAGFAYEWSEATYQEKKTGGQTGFIFAVSLLFVILVLAALYESWAMPVAILLVIPFGVFGAFLGLFLRSFDNNVYTQIGLIMLVGLAAKNAILIVEFAKLKREQGEPIEQAALDGAKLRLRPILMTSFAFILGTVPLAIALGAGAGARQALGTAVVFGMLVATLVGVFFIPVFYVMLQRVSERQWPFRRADAGAARSLACPQHVRLHRPRAKPSDGSTCSIQSSTLRACGTLRSRCCSPCRCLRCMVGPDYQRPEVEVPAAWRFGATEAGEISNIAWWDQFEDPVLSSLVRTALANNKDRRDRDRQRRPGRCAIWHRALGGVSTAERRRDGGAAALEPDDRPRQRYWPRAIQRLRRESFGELRAGCLGSVAARVGVGSSEPARQSARQRHRRADRRRDRRQRLHPAARAGPAARDRAADLAEPG